MKKINVLEVNNIDLIGANFNGYDLISDLSSGSMNVKQAVIYKKSDNPNVVKILKKDYLMNAFYKLNEIEDRLSIHNIFSITSPALMKLSEYKEADVVHFHMFHNTKLSLSSLIDIASEKQVIISLHDPWFLTGRCVHFYKCNKWEDGCKECQNLGSMFPFSLDNCHDHWIMKQNVLDNPNISFIVSSNWMYDLAIKSPLIKDKSKIHLIPFGIDLNHYKAKKAINKYNISDDYITIFFRAQNEFKGAKYIKEALEKLNVKKKIAILTCDNIGLFDDLKNKYKIVDLGVLEKEDIINAFNFSDIFLMPSSGESFGLMAVEAMACELPVVIFNNTALPSVTNAPNCGYMVEDKNSEELMKAIDYLINNEDERKKRGKLGRQLCEKLYSKEKYLDKIKNLYNDLSKKEVLSLEVKENYNDLDYLEFYENCNKVIHGNKNDFSLRNINLHFLNKYNKDFYNNLVYHHSNKFEYNPLISVIIPVYNGANFVAKAIKSVLAQTYNNYEIIVVDDGSTDKTRKVIEKFGSKVRYFYKENGGVATALNYGISKMKGEFFAWLSHDDLYVPEKLEMQVKVLNQIKNKQTVLFSNFYLVDAFDNVIGETFFLNNTSNKELCISYYPVLKGYVNGCTILINKKCFEKVGLFNEELKTSQDYDMWLRLFKEFPSLCIGNCLVRYRIHPKQDTNSNEKTAIEGNEFWNMLCNNLSTEEIISWKKDPFDVYMNLYMQMKNSNFQNASKIAYDKAKNTYKNINPEISLIIPIYNAEKYMKKTLDSVLEQNYTNFEVLLVDDNSTDNSYKVAEKYLSKDFRFKLLKNQYEKGVSGALNTGLSNARGNYFARLDSDDTMRNDKLLKQLKVLKNNRNVGYVATNINLMNAQSKVSVFNSYENPSVPIEYLVSFINPIPNATIMYDLSLIRKNKLKFDNLKTSEDFKFLTDFILNTKCKGYFINEGLYNYRLLDNSLFHSNVSLSLENARNISENYIKQIVGKNLKSYYDVNEFTNSVEKLNPDYCLNTYRYLAKYFSEYFNFSDKEKNEIILYMADKYNRIVKKEKKEKIVRIHDNRTKKYYVPKTKIGNKFLYYYRTHGFIKTTKWIVLYPVKKIAKK